MLADTFIRRPRLAGVISIVLFIAGLIALTRMPVEQFPDIVPPQVQVTASYPGAGAEVTEQTVAQAIEDQVIGVDDMIYMSLDLRRRRHLFADDQLRGRHRPRHRHGQRAEPRGAGRAAPAARGAPDRRADAKGSSSLLMGVALYAEATVDRRRR
jgi:hypothetical protein